MGNLRRPRVVVAEDEYVISLDVADSAKEAGFEVVGIAPDGERALELIAEHMPDAAILDVRMPKMDGLEAARSIRDRFSIPVIIMTAFEAPEILEEAREAGVGAYLVKPPSAAAMKRAVELALARNEDLVELRRLNAELQNALARVRTLEGMITICSYCKKIRSDEQQWEQLEDYVSEHSDAVFSHGICPTCFEKRPWEK